MGAKLLRILKTLAALGRGTALILVAAGLVSSPSVSAREAGEVLQPADSIEGNFLAGYVASAARDTAAAATYYREALKADPRNQDLQERAFISFLADGAMPEAIRLAERIAQKDSTNGLAHLALGVRAIKAKQYQTARTHLSKGVRGRQVDPTSTLLTAWSHAGSGDVKKALETVERLKSERSYNLFRDYHAGLIAEFLGNLPEAERRLKAAYEAERNTLRVVDAYGRFESRRGNRDAALAAYTEFDRVMPRHPVIRDALAQLNEGKKLAPLIANVQEGAAEVLYGLGAAGTSPGNELAGIVYLRLALHLAPEHGLALITLADSYESMKDVERAVEIFSRLPKDSPMRKNADIAIGAGLEQMGKGEDAVRHLEGLIKERPDDVDALMALGNVLRSRKRFAEAAEIYTRAIDRIGTPDASHWLVFFYRGTSFERSKQWDKAEADLKKALELIPERQTAGRAQVLNYLAYSWVDMGRNIDEAFRMLQRAVELAPRDGMIIDSLGWAYYKLGRYEDAVRELEKAVDLKPGDPVINDHLGDAYWKVGRTLEARFQWNHAKASDPEHEDLIKILKKIDNGLDDAPATAEDRPVDPTDPQRRGG
jgi:tetratricopeptide (TPR) repeat protein